MPYNKDDDDEDESLIVVVLELQVWEGEWKSAMWKNLTRTKFNYH